MTVRQSFLLAGAIALGLISTIVSLRAQTLHAVVPATVSCDPTPLR